jgi:hypothetical protein
MQIFRAVAPDTAEIERLFPRQGSRFRRRSAPRSRPVCPLLPARSGAPGCHITATRARGCFCALLRLSGFSREKVVRPGGFEPLTFCSGGLRRPKTGRNALGTGQERPGPASSGQERTNASDFGLAVCPLNRPGAARGGQERGKADKSGRHRCPLEADKPRRDAWRLEAGAALFAAVEGRKGRSERTGLGMSTRRRTGRAKGCPTKASRLPNPTSAG